MKCGGAPSLDWILPLGTGTRTVTWHDELELLANVWQNEPWRNDEVETPNVGDLLCSSFHAPLFCASPVIRDTHFM
jgi:hypothetical protein